MAENKNEEFREYLEKKQVFDVLTSAFVELYFMDQKPDDPLHFLMEKFKEASTKIVVVKEEEAPQQSG
eukprot:CAMPEP_0113962602 /NCGR_PEP_ID=MMETSP0011_2-20120614/6016_1 /TAXON_ID=101924 /ORGANISM="Rhodosorus marinus" /LENGTH=67 /DNA_ID=CAMNT_0000974493 /DNA_START=78 /DNA_END=281 /DNA_ORIENTATION=- /assembly_acc=CAM_ASM_000156